MHGKAMQRKRPKLFDNERKAMMMKALSPLTLLVLAWPWRISPLRCWKKEASPSLYLLPHPSLPFLDVCLSDLGSSEIPPQLLHIHMQGSSSFRLGSRLILTHIVYTHSSRNARTQRLEPGREWEHERSSQFLCVSWVRGKRKKHPLQEKRPTCEWEEEKITLHRKESWIDVGRRWGDPGHLEEYPAADVGH